MSSLDLELDGKMEYLETEWRQAHDACIVAHAEYHALSADPEANALGIDGARQRLNRAEMAKARIMARIERLEDSMLGLG